MSLHVPLRLIGGELLLGRGPCVRQVLTYPVHLKDAQVGLLGVGRRYCQVSNLHEIGSVYVSNL